MPLGNRRRKNSVYGRRSGQLESASCAIVGISLQQSTGTRRIFLPTSDFILELK